MIYNKYLFKGLAAQVIVVTLTVTAMIWIVKALRLVDLIVNKGLDLGSYLYISSCMLPALFFTLLPITGFIGVVMYFNKISQDSELIILKTSGLSPFAIAKPVIQFGAVLALVSYFISFYLLPVSYTKLKETIAFVRDSYLSTMLQEKVFNNPIKGLTMYIEEKHEDGLMKGIFVQDFRISHRPVIMAQEGRFVKTKTGPRLELTHGNRQEIHKDNQLSMLYFDSFSLDMSFDVEDGKLRIKEPEERSIPQLLASNEEDEAFTNKLRAEGHRRLTWPIYIPIVMAFASSIITAGSYSRRGQARRIIVCALTITAVLVGELGVNYLVSLEPAISFICYLYPAILIGIIFLQFNKGSWNGAKVNKPQ